MVDETDAPQPRRPPRRSALSRRAFPHGTDPDPRFTLANERTFLAWIRTSLALLAGGLGIEAFAADVFPEAIRKSVAVLLLSIGALLSLNAALRWVRVERAMRTGAPLPIPMMVPVLAVGGAAGAIVVGVLIVGVS